MIIDISDKFIIYCLIVAVAMDLTEFLYGSDT